MGHINPCFTLNKKESYKEQLSRTEDWIGFLFEHSNLPGPRGNLELLRAASESGDEPFFNQCLDYNQTATTTNTPGEFIAACGTAGLGKLVSEGKHLYYGRLRQLASDPRWRVREGVAFALQYAGRKGFRTLLTNIDPWTRGNPFEKRAVVAGLCEPDLLAVKEHAELVLNRVFEIAFSITGIRDRKSEAFRVLRKGLGYGISVSIVACPEKGKILFEDLLRIMDPDVQWIVRENLKKKRLVRMDPNWANQLKKETT